MFRPVVILAFFLALCACDDLGLTAQYQAQMMQAAQKAADAQQMHLQHGAGPEARYSTSLHELLAFDASLTDDSQITFSFGPITGSGYRFTVKRKGIVAAVVCDAEDDCRLLTEGVTR